MSKKFLLLLLSCLLFFASCRKDIGNASWETGIVMPLARTTLTINDLLADSLLQANPDSSVMLVYNNPFYTIGTDSLVEIPDTTIANSYNYSFSSFIDLIGGDNIFPYTTTQTEYALNGPELTYAIIHSGGVLFQVRSDVEAPIEFNYQLPTAKLNGIPFNITVTVPPANGSAQGVFTKFYDLSGYEVSLTGLANDRVNTIVTASSARISPDFTGTVRLYNSDTLHTAITFADLQPGYASGYFGQGSLSVGPAITDFSLFQPVVGGSLQLEDVKLDLEVENRIGVDARVNISDLSSINTSTNTTIPLNHPVIGSNININRAWINSSGILVPTYNTFQLNPQNSNIQQVIENLPDQLSYALNAELNPLGNVSGHKDFIIYGQGLKASLNMEVPLSLIATDLALADTVMLSISDEEAQKIKRGTFTVFADNGFPLDAALQLYVLDDNNNRIDSIMPLINNIDEAPVDAGFKVTGKKLTKLRVPVSESQMQHVLSSKRLLLVTTFNTAAQPNYVKIYSHYGIDIRLTGDFDYELELE